MSPGTTFISKWDYKFVWYRWCFLTVDLDFSEAIGFVPRWTLVKELEWYRWMVLVVSYRGEFYIPSLVLIMWNYKSSLICVLGLEGLRKERVLQALMQETHLQRCFFLCHNCAGHLLLLLGASRGFLSSFGRTWGLRPETPFPVLSGYRGRWRTLQEMWPEFRHRSNREMGAEESWALGPGAVNPWRGAGEQLWLPAALTDWRYPDWLKQVCQRLWLDPHVGNSLSLVLLSILENKI